MTVGGNYLPDRTLLLIQRPLDVSQTTDQTHQEQGESTSTPQSASPAATATTTESQPHRPGNRPIQQTDPERAIRYMHDTACEDDEDSNEDQTGFFKHYVNTTEQPELLRDYIQYEADRECRRHRIGYVNQRLTQLKEDQEQDQANDE